jgi:hypothetical protein
MTKMIESPMSWARLLGLLQTDGNFYFVFDKKDNAFKPRVTITVTPKRGKFITKIKDFLKSNGINVTKTNANPDRSVNISVERTRNCLVLINQIDLLDQKGFSLLDQKKRDFEILKEAIRLNDAGKVNGARTLETKKKLVDLKARLSEKELQTPSTSASNQRMDVLAEQLGLIDDTWKGSADKEWEKIKTITTDKTNAMVALSETVKGNVQNIPTELGEFMSGVWEGDGSFQISIKTHVDAYGNAVVVRPANKSPWKRRLIEIKPEINLTDHSLQSSNGLYCIALNLFSSKPKAISKVGSGKRADRLYLKSVADLQAFVLPFFERFPPSYERALYRFKAFRLVLKYYKKILQSESKHLFVVKSILESEYFDGEQRKPLIEYNELIKKQFNKDK